MSTPPCGLSHKDCIMKKDLHPNYRQVVFKDEGAGFAFSFALNG